MLTKSNETRCGTNGHVGKDVSIATSSSRQFQRRHKHFTVGEAGPRSWVCPWLQVLACLAETKCSDGNEEAFSLLSPYSSRTYIIYHFTD